MFPIRRPSIRHVVIAVTIVSCASIGFHFTPLAGMAAATGHVYYGNSGQYIATESGVVWVMQNGNQQFDEAGQCGHAAVLMISTAYITENRMTGMCPDSPYPYTYKVTTSLPLNRAEEGKSATDGPVAYEAKSHLDVRLRVPGDRRGQEKRRP